MEATENNSTHAPLETGSSLIETLELDTILLGLSLCVVSKFVLKKIVSYPYWKVCYMILINVLSVTPPAPLGKSADLFASEMQSLQCPVWEKPGLGIALPLWRALKPLSGALDFRATQRQQRLEHRFLCRHLLPGDLLTGRHCLSLYFSSQFLKILKPDIVVYRLNFPGEGYPVGQSANSRF